MLPPHPLPTLFPYTTLFRSMTAEVSYRGRTIPPQEQVMSVIALDLLEAHWGDLSLRSSGLGRESEGTGRPSARSEEHTSELQSRFDLVCRLLLEKKKHKNKT